MECCVLIADPKRTLTDGLRTWGRSGFERCSLHGQYWIQSTWFVSFSSLFTTGFYLCKGAVICMSLSEPENASAICPKLLKLSISAKSHPFNSQHLLVNVCGAHVCLFLSRRFLATSTQVHCVWLSDLCTYIPHTRQRKMQSKARCVWATAMQSKRHFFFPSLISFPLWWQRTQHSRSKLGPLKGKYWTFV